MNGFLRFLAWVAVIGGALAAIGYYTYADVWVVPTDDPRLLASVEPTLRGGDLLLVARHGAPALGNLVRCVDPDEPRRWVAARIVGNGGSELKVSDRAFSATGSRETSNGACDSQRVANPATGDEVDLVCRNEEFAGLTYQILHRQETTTASDHPVQVNVPQLRSYLLSDNRFLHLDSRDYGSLPSTSCQHLFFRLWGGGGFTDSARRFNILW